MPLLTDAGDSCIKGALHAAEGTKHLIAGHPVAEFEVPLCGVEGGARVDRIGRG